jgi:hypothetical protein
MQFGSFDRPATSPARPPQGPHITLLLSFRSVPNSRMAPPGRNQVAPPLMLETDLFARPGAVDPDFLQWFSLDLEDSIMGPGGCPWDCNWAGMFALCAPRLSPGLSSDILLVKAHLAIKSPRPTRIVLVIDKSMSSGLSDLECSLVGQTSVIVLENDAATGLSSKAHTRASNPPQSSPRRWSGPCSRQPRPPWCASGTP